MESYMVIILGFGLLIFLSLIVLFFINRLMIYKTIVLKKQDDIILLLDDRVSYMDDIRELVKSELDHEEEYIKRVEGVRVEVLDRSEEVIQLVRKTDKIFFDFIHMEDVYSFLKKKDKYLELKNKVLLNQDRVLYLLEGYDRGVRDYNNYLGRKFIRVLAIVFRFTKFDYYNG